MWMTELVLTREEACLNKPLPPFFFRQGGRGHHAATYVLFFSPHSPLHCNGVMKKCPLRRWVANRIQEHTRAAGGRQGPSLANSAELKARLSRTKRPADCQATTMAPLGYQGPSLANSAELKAWLSRTKHPADCQATTVAPLGYQGPSLANQLS
jgi:hypothetical protein